MADLKSTTLTLIFGPQDPDISGEQLDDLRTALLESPRFQWMIDLLTNLKPEWSTIATAHPELQAFQGSKYLQILGEWMRRGVLPPNIFPMPNVLVTPLVVITQLVQYTKFVEQINPKIMREDALKGVLKIPTETAGLCTGLLSSAAVASSGSLAELEKYGATAIRMAMAIGALVDAGDSEIEDGDKWQSLAVGWTTQTGEMELTSIVEHFPGAYISVISEARLATLTILKKDTDRIQEALKNSGFIFTKTTLRGPFHCARRKEHATALLNLFDSESTFHFPASSQLAFKTREANGSRFCDNDRLHQMATCAMLTEQANWHKLFNTLHDSTSLAVTFGSQRFVPQWFLRKLGPNLSSAADLDIQANICPAPMYALLDPVPDYSIAVVGMACHFPGGRDLDEFWQTICAGESQAREVSVDRVNFEHAAWRDSKPGKKWYGNFVQDCDMFDHKFFQNSPREVVSTDPQHRLMLQVAYQAVQQSGYFNKRRASRNVGCYVGIGVTDYENNVACYEPTAYTATGNLKSFAAGKISHFFGWSGPGVTIDTACSSSALAVHHACTAILSGECVASLAGGVSIMTSPEWYQNLGGASFLSPTGQCKPFDAAADGYCRGEGAGAVFLKELSIALEEGDQVLGVIRGSSVNQNENCSAITAPSVLSLSKVFSSVLRKARLDPKQITVVEAHGTGTQVGDKAEYDSIRKTLGGPGRAQPLNLGSVKGLIGHLECGSGIAALIKVLLMIQHGFIPPQPGFRTLNPKLKALPSDNIDISKSLKPWQVEFRAALLNNYGASGSNASLIITQPNQATCEDADLEASIAYKRPFWFSGFDNQSLRSYAGKMSRFLRSRKKNVPCFSIPNVSFQLSRQSNRSLGEALIFSCSSIDDLEAKLGAFADGHGELISTARRMASRPVILTFGGQRSNFVGLDREAYDSFPLLRGHLDRCHHICLSLGLGGMVPAIFERTPRKSIVELQTMKFALQYSCARSWIDSGVQVSALVGHSLGELTAMCVSGVLSLEHALRIISERARVIEAKWGTEKGRMVAVEGNLEDVQGLLKLANAASPVPVNIACYNGPRNFTLSGTSFAMERIKQTIIATPAFSNIKTKDLETTHAFHSSLVDDLIPELEKLGEYVIFRKPVLHHERATQETASGPPVFTAFASHMRDPVYFGNAVERLAEKYPSSIWLEAGSGSGVTALAHKSIKSNGMIFQSINITSSGAVQNITDATINLWKAGLNISFWEHVEPAVNYPILLLPPYQFVRSRHWLDRRKPEVKQIELVMQAPETRTTMWSFIGFQDSAKMHARFQIYTESEEFQTHVGAHFIAQTAAICPSMVQQVIARDALASLVEDLSLLPTLEGMESESPLCLDGSKQVWLDAERGDNNPLTWYFRITSTEREALETIQHVSGRITFQSSEDISRIFDTYERLVDHKRALGLLDGEESDQVIKGSRNIYRMFAPVVDYKANSYKGLQKLVSAGNESAGRILKQDPPQTLLSVGLGDSFCQVAGVFLNCMTDCDDGKMYLSNRSDMWMRSPSFPIDVRPERWDVYARHQRSPKGYLSDIFAFDADSGKLVWVVLGLQFVEVSISGMSRLLTKLTEAQPAQQAVIAAAVRPGTPLAEPFAKRIPPAHVFITTPPTSITEPDSQKAITKKEEDPDILGGVRSLLMNLLGLDADEIQLHSDLVELGIDSLLAMEVAREVEKKFETKFELEELMDMTDVRSLVNTIRTSKGITASSDSSPGIDGDRSDELVMTSSVSDSIATPGGDVNGDIPGIYKTGEIQLSARRITDIFTETKLLSDQFIEENQLSGYCHHVQPKLTELVVVYILDALDQMGCSLRSALPGETIPQIPHLPKHDKVMAVFRDLLEKARLVSVQCSTMTRTTIPVPSKPASKLLQELLHEYPEHYYDHMLTSLTGTKLADCLTGKLEGIHLLFGSPEGRELAAGMYGKSPINMAWLRQLQLFWEQFMAQVPAHCEEPLHILELGAGTGGTTAALLPLLARSGIPVSYTASDISPSLVAGLRKRFKEYPWMRFEVVDIEKEAPGKLLESQHIVLATNCVHATHNLAKTTKNIHKMLRPDGFLTLLEMTEPLPWVDSVFGLVEGWWLFNDGRHHALVQPEIWEKTLHGSGYGKVEWTDGDLPENSIQRLIIALASPEKHSRVSEFSLPPLKTPADFSARQIVIDSLVHKHIDGFVAPSLPPIGKSTRRCVLVTGATGCLGSHIVAHLAELPDVRRVICLNRGRDSDAAARQLEALELWGLLDENISKLDVIETDSSAPTLGLCPQKYQYLVKNVTDIVHNAWAMSMTRPVRGFEPKFKAMRNLIDLSRACASEGRKVGFQFISSVAVVGCHPFLSGQARVPEQRVTVESALPMGYADAKLVCEHMLDKSLHRYPESFRTSSVRVGQISGSKVNGNWNPVEHLVHLIKSSHTLGVFPALDGVLSWCPVNDVAATLRDLLLGDQPVYPIYHIENPVRQPWPEMAVIISKALNIPPTSIIPYEEWLHSVRQFPPSLMASENPAARLADFFEMDFVRMACGGVILDTAHTKEHSETFRGLGSIDESLVRKYIQAWKESGFLHS
ncbi:type I iterative polyketide synthase [Penicillium paradoxum]|uniref:type I iterative polyketide synthase n=1 Tax=Penicillium paradoxum TaxID=176176 RepID=UPI002546C0DC|nr:type I iterative polyketide synthase [Penicillium paradoxum]KAJ5788397.1 type I iterative polyketide synthase [Penicillium paradoxum]